MRCDLCLIPIKPPFAWGVKSILYYTFAWFVKKSHNIIKKKARTQYARAKIYANYPFLLQSLGVMPVSRAKICVNEWREEKPQCLDTSSKVI